MQRRNREPDTAAAHNLDTQPITGLDTALAIAAVSVMLGATIDRRKLVVASIGAVVAIVWGAHFTAQTTPTIVHGFAHPGFDNVKDAFLANFAAGRETGAALAIEINGSLVVDLWAGLADRDAARMWRNDTMQVVFSATKGIAATVIAKLVDAGLVRYSDPVAMHWPEFGQAGKANVTVAHVMSHSAGLSCPEQLTGLQVTDYSARAVGALEEQQPLWEPGSQSGYHPWTYGFMTSEIARRVDPQGRSLGRIFADDIATPLGIDFFVGVPQDLDHRVARLNYVDAWTMARGALSIPHLFKLYATPSSLTARSLTSPRAQPHHFNNPDMRQLELACCTGAGTARGLAKLYSVLAQGGSVPGHTIVSAGTLSDATSTVTHGTDVVLNNGVAYAMGFVKSCPHFPITPTSRGFGHPGFGGTVAFADPDHHLGFAYTPNAMNPMPSGVDPRFLLLRDAVYAALEGA